MEERGSGNTATGWLSIEKMSNSSKCPPLLTNNTTTMEKTSTALHESIFGPVIFFLKCRCNNKGGFYKGSLIVKQFCNLFWLDHANTQQEARKARAASGISAEAWLSLWVRGGEAVQCCWEKGEQTPLLVPDDNSETCVGRHGLPTGRGSMCLNAVVVPHLCVERRLAG